MNPTIVFNEVRRKTEQSCPFCGTALTSERVNLHPSWCRDDQGWHVCGVCRSVRRVGHVTVHREIPDGWVVPVQFLKDRLFRFGSKRPGAFVDCSPMALLQGPGSRVFEESLTISELAESPNRQFSSLTCYSCVETSPDIEWVLRMLIARLRPGGVLRLLLLRSPYLSAPTPLTGWGVPEVLDIEHLPSELGLSCLFARVGLRVARRRRTPMMPITPGLELSRQLAQRLNPLTVLKLAALPAFNLTSFGFGEELELQPGTV